MTQVDETTDAAGVQETPAQRLDHRFELFEAIVLAIAAMLTAWAAFQATKWSGEQTDNYSRAAAARTESAKASTRGGQLTVIDVNTFTSWIAALGAEDRAGQDNGLEDDGTYTPQAGTESAFIYDRFRTEFRTAVDAWLATDPLSDPDASRTPFTLPEYAIADLERAADLEAQAEASAAQARQANQRGDNYVLMTILFASVLVVLGIGSKMDTFRARAFLFSVASLTLVGAAIVLFTFPVKL
jgi:hypothetical protein